MRTRLLVVISWLAAFAPGIAAQAKPDPTFEAETLAHFQALVQLDTSSPPGNEIRAVQYLQEVLKRRAFRSRCSRRIRSGPISSPD